MERIIDTTEARMNIPLELFDSRTQVIERSVDLFTSGLDALLMRTGF
jgi:hypothetical protein